MNYTAEQKKAIETVDKNLVVTAGAGAGKTRVLVDRILYILEQGLADIDEIVAITYTKKAAMEIRERLRREIKRRKDNVHFSKVLQRLGIAYIGTIHSFCLRILQENPIEAGIDPDVEVLAEYRANAWLKECIKEGIVKNIEEETVFNLTSELGFSKLSDELYKTMVKMFNQGLGPSFFYKKAESKEEKTLAMLINTAYKFFEQRKEDKGFLDYEGILQKTLNMFEKNREILNHYRNKFKFILIDEYQDLNFVQDAILRLLGEDTNFFVVGDRKQSIYGFRGARVELFEKLRMDLESQGQAINLKDNFRSDEQIIEFVNKGFEGLMEGYESIVANRPRQDGANLCFLMPESQGLMSERRQCEAEFIAHKILEMIGDDTVKVFDKDIQGYRNPTFKDFAVLLRRKTHLKHYLNAFRDHKIPFHVTDAGNLTDSSFVKTIICALKTLEFKDSISLYGTLSNLLGIEDEIMAEYVIKGRELISGLEEEANYESTSESLTKAFQLIRQWCKIKEVATLRELVGRIIDDTSLLTVAAQKELTEVENLFKFLDLCRDYDEQGYTLNEFLAELSAFGEDQQEAIDVSEDQDVVRVITIHSSKGLEFPIVILADSGHTISSQSSEILFEPELGFALKKDKEKWDSIKQGLEKKEIEEAKRLLYVALTRARDYLLISGEMTSGRRDSFLKWLDPEICKVPIVINQQLPDITGIDVETFLTVDGESRPERHDLSAELVVPQKYFPVTLLGDFSRCPKRYYFSQVMGIAEEVFYKSDSSLPGLSGRQRGTIVHELIERMHEGDIIIDDLGQLLREDKRLLNPEDSSFIQRCIKNYLESDLYKVSGKRRSETPFTYCIKNRCFVTGKIDHMILEKDGLTIVDFKTNVRIDPSLLESYKLQVMTYALAMHEIYDIKLKKVIIASLFNGEFIEVDISPITLKKCKTEIFQIIHKIENRDFRENTKVQENCNICGYKGVLCKQ